MAKSGLVMADFESTWLDHRNTKYCKKIFFLSRCVYRSYPRSGLYVSLDLKWSSALALGSLLLVGHPLVSVPRPDQRGKRVVAF